MGRAGRRIFPPRLRRGTRHPDAPPLLAPHRRASVRHPEGASGKRGRTRSATCYAQRGKAVSSEVTSGCPKRSEGGSPVGTRTITAFPSGIQVPQLFQTEPRMSAVFQAEPNGRNEPSDPPPARTCPSRPVHPEEHAGRRHRSSPRPVRVRRLHAHRWRLRG